MASCVGKLASVAVKAKLDSGAEAANWIEPALIKKLKLRKNIDGTNVMCYCPFET